MLLLRSEILCVPGLSFPPCALIHVICFLLPFPNTEQKNANLNTIGVWFTNSSLSLQRALREHIKGFHPNSTAVSNLSQKIKAYQSSVFNFVIANSLDEWKM